MFNYHSPASNTNESSLESENHSFQRYHHGTIGNRNGLGFHHHPSVNQPQHVNHRPTLPMHGVQPNPPRGAAIPLQPGLHILQSRGVMSENTLIHQSVHPLESAQVDVILPHYFFSPKSFL